MKTADSRRAVAEAQAGARHLIAQIERSLARLAGARPLTPAALAEAWMDVVKLRHRLLHDYPLQTAARFEKFSEATAAIDTIRDSAGRATGYLRAQGLIP